MEQVEDEKMIRAYLKEFKKSNISFNFMYIKIGKAAVKLHIDDTVYQIEHKKEWLCIRT